MTDNNGMPGRAERDAQELIDRELQPFRDFAGRNTDRMNHNREEFREFLSDIPPFLLEVLKAYVTSLQNSLKGPFFRGGGGSGGIGGHQRYPGFKNPTDPLGGMFPEIMGSFDRGPNTASPGKSSSLAPDASANRFSSKAFFRGNDFGRFAKEVFFSVEPFFEPGKGGGGGEQISGPRGKNSAAISDFGDKSIADFFNSTTGVDFGKSDIPANDLDVDIFSFAHGGSFTIGGVGGEDSQLLILAGSPGEEVNFRRAHTARSPLDLPMSEAAFRRAALALAGARSAPDAVTRDEMNAMEASLRDEIRAVDGSVETRVASVASDLVRHGPSAPGGVTHDEVNAMEGSLRGEIRAVDGSVEERAVGAVHDNMRRNPGGWRF